jgi:hypothetical protein
MIVSSAGVAVDASAFGYKSIEDGFENVGWFAWAAKTISCMAKKLTIRTVRNTKEFEQHFMETGIDI